VLALLELAAALLEQGLDHVLIDHRHQDSFGWLVRTTLKDGCGRRVEVALRLL